MFRIFASLPLRATLANFSPDSPVSICHCNWYHQGEGSMFEDVKALFPNMGGKDGYHLEYLLQFLKY